MGDQPHGHGDIQAVLRKEASDIALTIAIDACFEAGIGLGDEIDEPENQEDDESGKNELLSFHCVFPQKNGS
jgi:hypothetical protein